MYRIKQPIDQKSNLILNFFGVFILVVIYSWLSYKQHVRNPLDTTIPNFSQLIDGIRLIFTPHDNNNLRDIFGVGEEKGYSFTSTWIYKDSVATFGRLFTGLILGSLMSIILGVLMGCEPRFAAFLIPPISFLAKVPGTAMLAVFLVMVGHGENMFTAMIAFGVLPTLTQSIYLSARDDVHEEEIDKAYTLGASSFEAIWNIVLRKILPRILDSVRLQIGPAMVCLIAAEMLVGSVGLGYQIRMQQRLQQMNVVYIYLIILGISGLLMDKGMIYLRRYMCPWYRRELFKR